VLNDSVGLNSRLEDVMRELLGLVEQPSTRTALLRLKDTFDTAEPLARWVVPAQTNCNYWNYWFTSLPNGLSDESTIGYTFRQALTNYPPGPENFTLPNGEPGTVGLEAEAPMANYSGIQSNGQIGTTAPPDPGVTYAPNDFAPYKIPITYAPVYGPAGQNLPGQDFDDCQAGQAGLPLGRLGPPGNGQPLSNPAIGVPDLPGSRGPTTLFWGQDSTRQIRDTRVDDRQPQTWDGL
jgi:hypothetical protein